MRPYCCLIALLIAWSAHANSIITVPFGLLPGDHYRLAFVTSVSFTAGSSDIATYNADVTTTADAIPALAALGATWYAIAYTATVSAPDNIGATSSPIYDLEGNLITTGTTALFGSALLSPIDITEQGTIFEAATWTGHGSHTMGTAFAELGTNYHTDSTWLDNTFDRPTTLTDPLYGISSELTASEIPEPGGLFLAGPGLLLVLLSRFRRG